jgi:hypothetical protein
VNIERKRRKSKLKIPLGKHTLVLPKKWRYFIQIDLRETGGEM